MFIEFYEPLPSSNKRILFLDRDNTIIKDSGYFHDANNLVFLDQRYDFLGTETLGNTIVALVSNQSGIGRGIFDVKDALEVNRRIREKIVADKGVIHVSTFCPHKPSDQCSCRKPKTQMFRYLLAISEVNVKDCLFIGDSSSDEEAALALGCAFYRAGQSGIRNSVLRWCAR